ncbi:uncharacterized protein LOC106373990 [Brassica napus]|uniref:uncharacterized protein LOC106373990 n=1 Tax=Brassica napus TaxID=3708 RepID=UPI0006AB1ACB|nr:uncharacterized protein LOC106373990 [Brassica napus]
MEVMRDFMTISGLHINATKSTIFAAGPDLDTLLAEATSLAISVGTLRICYMGMPLTTKSLTSIDYEQLIDKVRRKTLTWSNRSLSFVGRLQLINSVVIRSPNQTHKAKVSWADLCYPNAEGVYVIVGLLDQILFAQGFEVKDGKSTFFWFYNWLDKGRLIDVTCAAGTTYIGLPRRATVSDAVKQNK